MQGRPRRSGGLRKASHLPIADCILAPRQVCRRRDQAVRPVNPIEAIADPALSGCPNGGYYPLYRPLFWLSKNPAFGSFPLGSFFGSF
jgi:hypothetical protein